MAITKRAEDSFVLAGERAELLEKCREVLEAQGFGSVTTMNELYQVKGNYRKLTTWGDILVTLTPEGKNTRILIKSSANVDNIYALFKDPSRMILDQFKDGWKGD